MVQHTREQRGFLDRFGPLNVRVIPYVLYDVLLMITMTMCQCVAVCVAVCFGMCFSIIRCLLVFSPGLSPLLLEVPTPPYISGGVGLHEEF